MKTTFVSVLTICAAVGVSSAATISDIQLSADAEGVVTVTYSLDADAVVTADFRAGGVSVGGTNQWTLAGDVHRLVTADGLTKSITWNVRKDMPETTVEDITVELKAWAESDAPDYMVADLMPSSPCRIRYFASVDFLPGGIVSNEEYRMYYMPFRKIRAKNVEWKMGTDTEKGRNTDGRETSHMVRLTSNYYIGVFEFTLGQSASVGAGRGGADGYNKENTWRFIPKNRTTYNGYRGNTCPPAEPSSSSPLGKIRGRIGFLVDLPTEAQWEFAARGGYGEGTWGDGSDILASSGTDAHLNNIGIYKYHGGQVMHDAGSCQPNGYGLYDMNGNEMEYCQDWWQPDITQLNGALCVDPTDSTKRADGVVGTNRVARGGHYNTEASSCRASARFGYLPGNYYTELSMRPMTYANLSEEVAPSVFVSTSSIASIDTHSSAKPSAATAGAVNLRTYHSLMSSGFDLDMLKIFGTSFILR